MMGRLGIEYVFKQLGIRKLCGEAFAYNTSSIRFHKKLGFTEEGRFLKHILKNGVYEDIVSFALFKDDWVSTKKQPHKDRYAEQHKLIPRELKQRYAAGTNITEMLRSSGQTSGDLCNTEYAIEVAYDLQTGTYTARMSVDSLREYIISYSQEIVAILESLGQFESILEAGVGEATILSEVITRVAKPFVKYYGFDLSWSRVAYARKWLRHNGHNNVRLCTGSLSDIPFMDSSIDIVLTSHAIEPNAGREREILKELYRITNKYLILLEPSYDLAGSEGKMRMAKLGYCRDLKQYAEELGYNVIRHDPFLSYDELNPTALTIIKKCSNLPSQSEIYACPKYKTPLKFLGGSMYSDEALTVYPIIDGIPCLRVESGIIASKFPIIVSETVTA